MFREVLRKVCVDELLHTVVGEAEDGEAAVQTVRRTEPDLVLLDLHLPKIDGFAVVEEIRQNLPAVKVLVLSSHCDQYTVVRAAALRLQGFVDKNTNSVASLKSAISAVAEGRTWFSEPFLRIKEALRGNPTAFDKLLSPRERAVLGCIGQAMSDEEIGRSLAISPKTVEKHRFNLLRKLGVKSTTELGRYAREHGFTLMGMQRGDDALRP
jgi:DNA-binding NarL/FixJ family response regulator